MWELFLVGGVQSKTASYTSSLKLLTNATTAEQVFALWGSLCSVGTGRMLGEEANRINWSLISPPVIERRFSPLHSRYP